MRVFVLALACLGLLFQADAKCLNWCNQRGICTSAAEGNNCICFMGFTGEDCSQRVCPSNFDPVGLDRNKNRRTVRVQVSAREGVLEGKYGFEFGGSEVYFPANAEQFTSAKCDDVLKGLKSVATAKCERERFDPASNAAAYSIQLLSYPEAPPFMNNLIYHDGNPPLHMFRCNISKIDAEEAVDPFCEITDIDAENGLPPPLYGECSMHGVCERVKGECECEKGFRGPACSDIRDGKDIVAHIHDGPFFTASILKLTADRPASSQFNVFQATIAKQNVTTISGDRELRHEGRMQVQRGGLAVVSSTAITAYTAQLAAAITTSATAGSDDDDDSSDSSSLINQADEGDVSAEDAALAAAVSIPCADKTNIRSHVAVPQQQHRTKRGDSELLNEEIDFHLLAFQGNHRVFSLSADGSGEFVGSLAAGNGSFSVDAVAKGWAQADNLEVLQQLQVRGSMNVEESMTIGSGFALTPGGMTVDVESHSGTLFELRSREAKFNGSLLEMHAVGEDCSMLKAVSDGLTTFELTSGGMLHTHGLHLQSGGVHVVSGGMQVDAGGLLVRGGLTIESGEMLLEQAQLRVGHLIGAADSGELQRPVFKGLTKSPYYSGSLLELTAVASVGAKSNSGSGSGSGSGNKETPDRYFSFVKLQTQAEGNGAEEAVFEIAGDGQIRSFAGADFSGAQGVTVQGPLSLRGDVSMQKVLLLPEPLAAAAAVVETSGLKATHQVLVPASASYVVVAAAAGQKEKSGPSAGSSSGAVRIEFETDGVTSFSGRILIISNTGFHTTAGALLVPPQSTVLFLHNGIEWVSVDALKAPVQELRGVRVLEAANDLHVGNHSVTARRFQATDVPRNRVFFAGVDGLLSDSDKFTYAKGVLTAPALKIEKLITSVDVRGNDLSNAKLTGAQLLGASISASDFSIPGQAGFAIFDAKGSLSASSALKVDAAGNIVIESLFANVNAQGYSIRNVTIRDAELRAVSSATMGEVFISSMASAAHSKKPAAVGDRDTKSFPFGYTLVAVNGEGKLLPALDLIQLDSTGAVSISELKSCKLTGRIDGNHQELTNALLIGGRVDAASSISATTVAVDGLRIAKKFRNAVWDEAGASNSKLWAEAARVVFVDPNGKLSASNSPEDVVHIPKLSITELSFKPTSFLQSSANPEAKGEFDFHGIALKNVKIDAGSIDFSKQTSAFNVQTLKVQSLASTDGDTSLLSKQQRQLLQQEGALHVVVHDAQGQIAAAPSIALRTISDASAIASTSAAASDTAAATKTVLDITSIDGLMATEISAERIQLFRPTSRSVDRKQQLQGQQIHPIISTDSDGFLVGSDSAVLQDVTAAKSLTIAADATVQLQGRTAALLGVNEDGEVVAVTTGSAARDESNSSGSKSSKSKRKVVDVWDVELNGVRAATVTADTVAAKVVETPALKLSSSAGAAGAINFLTSGGLLLVDETGMVGKAKEARINVKDGILRVAAISPATDTSSTGDSSIGGGQVEITNALLRASNITGSHIHNAQSVETKQLLVTDIAEFHDDVAIDGSVTVHGSVIGSGPYVDSSDSRLKKNVQPLQQALEKVSQLQAVSYYFRADEFPQRRLPTSAQLGWLSEDLQAVLPELVSQDAEGFGAVSYAHATVVVAEAVKELQALHQREIKALQVQIDELRSMLLESMVRK